MIKTAIGFGKDKKNMGKLSNSKIKRGSVITKSFEAENPTSDSNDGDNSLFSNIMKGWIEGMSRWDLNGPENNQRTNMLDLSQQQIGDVIQDDSYMSIIQRNIGDKFHKFLVTNTSNNKKISTEQFFDETSVGSTFVDKSNNGIKMRQLNFFFKKVFYTQIVNYFIPIELQVIWKIVRMEFESGADILVKKVDANSDPSKSYMTSDSYLKNQKFDLPGSEVSGITPIARSIGKQTTNVMLPVILLKAIFINLKMLEKLDNKFIANKELEDYSTITNVEFNVFDPSSMSPTQAFAELEAGDGEETVSVCVPSGQESDYIALIHLMCMFSTPFAVCDSQYERMTPINGWNFEEQNKIKKINVYCADENKFKLLLEKFDLNFWKQKTNVENVKSLFCVLVPHKQSAEMSDQVLFLEHLTSKVDQEGEFENQTLRFPKVKYISVIGMFKVVEPQYWGIDYSNLDIDAHIASNVQKTQSIIDAAKIYIAATTKEIREKNSAVSLNRKTIDSKITNIIKDFFASSNSEDILYNKVYETNYSFLLSITAPNIIQNCIDYINKVDIIVDTEISFVKPISPISIMIMRPYQNFYIPLLFNEGLMAGEVKVGQSTLEIETNTVDVVNNYYYNTNYQTNNQSIIDVTNLPTTFTVKDKVSQVYLPMNVQGMVTSNIDKSTLRLEIMEYETNMYSIADLEANNFPTEGEITSLEVNIPITYGAPRPSGSRKVNLFGFHSSLINKIILLPLGSKQKNTLVQFIQKYKDKINLSISSAGVDYKNKTINFVLISRMNPTVEKLFQILRQYGINVTWFFNDPALGGGGGDDSEGDGGGYGDGGDGIENQEKFETTPKREKLLLVQDYEKDKFRTRKSEIIKEIIKRYPEVRSKMISNGVDYVEKTKNKRCFWDTTEKIIGRMKIDNRIKQKKRNELAKYESENYRLDYVKVKTILQNLSIPVVVLVIKEVDGVFWFEEINKQKIPLAIIVYDIDTRHISELNDNMYLALVRDILQSESVGVGKDTWRDIISTGTRMELVNPKHIRRFYQVIKNQKGIVNEW